MGVRHRLKSRSILASLITLCGQQRRWVTTSQTDSGQWTRPKASLPILFQKSVKGASCQVRAVPTNTAEARSKLLCALRRYTAHNAAYDWCCSMRCWQCHYLEECPCVCVCVHWHVDCGLAVLQHARDDQQLQQTAKVQVKVESKVGQQQQKKCPRNIKINLKRQQPHLFFCNAFAITVRFCVGRPTSEFRH